MANQNFDPVVQSEATPVESPKTELATVLNEGDPDMQLAILERKAELAPRFLKAITTILVTQTYPEDWQEFDGTMCLSSAGAERVARHFDIKFFDVKNRKEEFTDTNGKGFRYVFEGNASMGSRIVFSQGVYSTRDKFLGYANKEWRAIEDINENHIRNAAYHIFIGNAVKALLGLRGIPSERFKEIMGGAGEKPDKAGKVTHANGSQGGTSADDTKNQQELSKLLMDMANAMQMIEVDDKGNYTITETSEISDPIEVAKASCKALTSFYSKKDSKLIAGLDSIKALKGQRLSIALQNVKKLQGGGE